MLLTSTIQQYTLVLQVGLVQGVGVYSDIYATKQVKVSLSDSPRDSAVKF